MVLHNILRKKSPLRYAPASRFESEDIESGRIILGKWSLDGGDESMHSVNVVRSNNYSQNYKEIREKYCEYFNSVGQVPWQEKFI